MAEQLGQHPDDIPAFETAPMGRYEAERLAEDLEALPDRIAEKVAAWTQPTAQGTPPAQDAASARPQAGQAPAQQMPQGNPYRPGGWSAGTPDSGAPDAYGATQRLAGSLGQLPGLGMLGQVAQTMGQVRSIVDSVAHFQETMDRLAGIAVTPREIEAEYQQNLSANLADPEYKRQLAEAQDAIARTRQEKAEAASRNTVEDAAQTAERMRRMNPNAPRELPENAAFDVPGMPKTGPPSLGKDDAEQARRSMNRMPSVPLGADPRDVWGPPRVGEREALEEIARLQQGGRLPGPGPAGEMRGEVPGPQLPAGGMGGLADVVGKLDSVVEKLSITLGGAKTGEGKPAPGTEQGGALREGIRDKTTEAVGKEILRSNQGASNKGSAGSGTQADDELRNMVCSVLVKTALAVIA